MHADKRRAGRAIRKQRRLEREAIATVPTWDFTPLVDAFAEAAWSEGHAQAIANIAWPKERKPNPYTQPTDPHTKPLGTSPEPVKSGLDSSHMDHTNGSTA